MRVLNIWTRKVTKFSPNIQKKNDFQDNWSFLKPHIYIFRGYINPDRTQKWFKFYRAFCKVAEKWLPPGTHVCCQDKGLSCRFWDHIQDPAQHSWIENTRLLHKVAKFGHIIFNLMYKFLTYLVWISSVTVTMLICLSEFLQTVIINNDVNS